MTSIKHFLQLVRRLVAVVFIITTVLSGLVAQDNVDFISQRFNSDAVKTIQEKAFAHTDKQVYLAGEICWFKLYLVDGAFHRPLDLSKVAYVELLDNKNIPVVQAKISMTDGLGNGSLTLPVSLNSGNYRFRAYTRWMQNYAADFFFETNLTVINPRKIYQGDSTASKTSYILNLYPEGGHMVNGVASRVACQLTDQYGHAISGDAQVVMDQRDTVSRFKVNDNGIGTFDISPATAHRYQVVLPQINVIADFPSVSDRGYVMHVDAEGDSVMVQVTTSAGLGDRLATLVAHTRQSLKIVRNLPFVNGSASFAFSKQLLGEGISHLTVFNELKQPVCERLVFRYPTEEAKLRLDVNASVLEARQKLSVAVGLDAAASTKNADLSMSVFRIDSLQPQLGDNIVSYLLLTSDLQGKVDHPNRLLDQSNPAARKIMDELMLTQGWRKFNWENITNGAQPLLSYAPEYSGHIIKGRVYKAGTGEIVKEAAAYLSVPGSRSQFYCNLTDSSGKLQFVTKDFYNNGEAIVQLDHSSAPGLTVEIFSPFSSRYSSRVAEPFTMQTVPSTAFINQNVYVQIENSYAGMKLRNFSYPKVDTSAFFGPADVAYNLDNYVRFTTMEEVLREYITPVNVRKKDNRFHLPVFDEPRKRFFEDDPLVLIDGVPVGDLNKVLQFDPLKVARMDVKSRTYFRGNLLFSGIVSMNTYQGDLAGLELDPRATVIDYEGLQLKRSFAAPVYETETQHDSHYPDFRTLLNWSPSIHVEGQTKATIPIYTSDVPGKYVVIVQGLTVEGKPLYGTTQFEVRSSPNVTTR
jgi:hypothetical protein